MLQLQVATETQSFWRLGVRPGEVGRVFSKVAEVVNGRALI